jgi:hypothetical protein
LRLHKLKHNPRSPNNDRPQHPAAVPHLHGHGRLAFGERLHLAGHGQPQDPQANPITAYWDAALTITAAQPIRTSGGYPSRSGTPARLYVASDYSIRVQNKNGSQVYSAPEATEAYGGGIINASVVVYDPAGLGAVPTTVQAKLRETVRL